MRKKLNTGWIVLIFGLLLLAVVVGSLLRVAELSEGTPTPWQEPAVFTMRPESTTDAPRWWDEKDTPPAWSTDNPERQGTAMDD